MGALTNGNKAITIWSGSILVAIFIAGWRASSMLGELEKKIDLYAQENRQLEKRVDKVEDAIRAWQSERRYYDIPLPLPPK